MLTYLLKSVYCRKFLVLLSALSALVVSLPAYPQVSQQDIRDLLIVQGNHNFTDLDAKSELIYNRLLDIKSYKFNDFMYAAGMSALSGIGQGAYESDTFDGYNDIDWMPGFLQKWFVNSKLPLKESNYKLFNWQMIFRETDYICDRIAYEKLNVFFKNQWYWAYLVHWIIKNTFATIVRDTFLSNHPFQSFKLNFILPIFN